MRFSEEKEYVGLLPPLVGSYRIAPVPVLPRPERRTVMRRALSRVWYSDLSFLADFVFAGQHPARFIYEHDA